jgi:thioredoxin-related protein
LLSTAGQRAIEKVKKGDPLVYGWMVDYFFRGYEANGIPAGMKVLQPYLDDPNCLTTKRQEIERRLKGMETLVPGAKAPDISLTDTDGKLFELQNYKTASDYILIFFWSADCSHCKETSDQLFPWQQQPAIQKKMSIVAISLDETDTEISAWEKKRKEMTGWKHLRAEAGVRSKVAADYFILATPVMVLLDARTRQVVAVPNTAEELKKAVK